MDAPARSRGKSEQPSTEEEGAAAGRQDQLASTSNCSSCAQTRCAGKGQPAAASRWRADRSVQEGCAMQGVCGGS